jgi:hypothetical protein
MVREPPNLLWASVSSNLQPPHPVERLPEGHDPARAQAQRRDVLGDRFHPVNVADPRLLAAPLSLAQHPALGVERGDLLEQPGQRQRQDTGPAANVEELPAAVQRQLSGHRAG